MLMLVYEPYTMTGHRIESYIVRRCLNLPEMHILRSYTMFFTLA